MRTAFVLLKLITCNMWTTFPLSRVASLMMFGLIGWSEAGWTFSVIFFVRFSFALDSAWMQTNTVTKGPIHTNAFSKVSVFISKKREQIFSPTLSFSQHFQPSTCKKCVFKKYLFSVSSCIFKRKRISVDGA